MRLTPGPRVADNGVMESLLAAYRLRKSFGSRLLFKDLSFGVAARDRVGLIGPNGAGKSTLLRILARLETADEGDLTRMRGLRVGFLQQVSDFEKDATIYETLLGAEESSHERDHLSRVDQWISRLELNVEGRTPETKVSSLSGGWMKRVALGRELIQQPDLLLLDEPTNHLDVGGILWLEDFLVESNLALIMVTHDRLFLQRIANRILDLDSRYKEGLLDIRGTYADYLEARDMQLASQQRQEETMRNRLRRETEWLRRGAKARQTKQKARIERAGDLQGETAEMTNRNQERRARIDFQENERRPQKLLDLQNLSASRGGRTLFKDVNLVVTPKTRLALLGPNGCGKSTLLRILVGQENPDSGTVLRAEQAKIVCFEQHRESLNPEISLVRAVCPDGDYVQERERPVFAKAYLSRFLFRPEQMDMPVAKLSGGEQARLRVAQMMLEPASVLILDEPTNDLDVPTLEVLAKSLEDFDGAVILVTHDRYFLDQVADEILAFPFESELVESTNDREPAFLTRFAGYEQWEMWHLAQEREVREKSSESPARESKGLTLSDGGASTSGASTKKRKLSYNEKREWESIEGVILERESELSSLEAEATLPEVVSHADRVGEIYQRISVLRSEIERLYARWAELESFVQGTS